MMILCKLETLGRETKRLANASMIATLVAASACATQSQPVSVTPPEPIRAPPIATTTASPIFKTASVPPRIDWLKPGPGTAIPLDVSSGGRFLGNLQVELDAEAVSSVELQIDGESRSVLSAPPWSVDTALDLEGAHDLTAVGRGADGHELTRASVRIVAAPPERMSCLDRLRADGIDFIHAPPQKGVDEPVLLAPKMAGVTYRFVGSSTTPRLLAACSMGPRLRQLAQLAKSLGFDEIIHVGIYNYRPMRNPTCEARGNCALSQHGHATAIDIHALGSTETSWMFSTQADWSIDKSVPICPGVAKSQGDGLLHAVACGMWERRIFSLVLTPNYNAEHRNHFHVDLTPVPPEIRDSGFGVDPADPELLDD